MIIGSHVSMGGKEMLLGSVKEALSYNANTFMFYTGAPQNTRRKPVSELRVEEAKELMKEKDISIYKLERINLFRKLIIYCFLYLGVAICIFKILGM